MFLAWLQLRYADNIYRTFSNAVSTVIAKWMAVVAAAIAVQYILTGLDFYYPPGKLGS